MSQQRFKTETLEDIIDRYSSPSPSMSSTMPRHHYHSSTPRHGTYGRNTSPVRSSPPPYSGEAPRRRQSSTNSGYFTRAELFGRASPALPSSVPSSRGLERIETRRRTGHRMPYVDAMSSPLTDMSSSVGLTPSDSLSAQDLHTAHASAFSQSSVQKSLNTEAASFKNLRNSFSGLPKDEWMQAGSQKKQMTGTGFGPGPTLNSQASYHSPSAVTTPKGNQNDGASKPVPGVRKISPAEEALRLTLSSLEVSCSPAPKSGGSNWAGKLFKRQTPGSTTRPTSGPRIPNDSFSDLGYVEPSMPHGSPQVSLARARELEDALQLGDERQAACTPDGSSNESTSFSVTLHNLPRSNVVYVADRTANDRIVLKSSDSSLQTYTSSLSDDRNLTSDIAATTDATHQDLLAQIESTEDPPVSPTAVTSIESIELSQPNMPNLAPPQKMTMSSIMEIIIEEPIPPAPPNMAFSAITELITQEPVIVQGNSGVTFAAANAIIYGCVTMAAMRYALNSIGSSVRAADLASDMVLAALIGFIFCAILHFAGYGRFRHVFNRLPILFRT